jgi:DNA-directed RNA polymerase specialized sigma24 family protein
LETVSSPHTSSELFRRVAAGDESAFRKVFQEFWPQVYGTSLHLTRSAEQAKDLAQDIFVKLWQKN